MTVDDSLIPFESLAPTFSAHELESVLAGKLRKHIASRLQTLRAKNDADLDPIPTAKLRGEIKALTNLKNLLAAESSRQMVADEG